MFVQLDAVAVDCFSLPADEPHLCSRLCPMKWAPPCSGACGALASLCPNPQLLLLVPLQPLAAPMPRSALWSLVGPVLFCLAGAGCTWAEAVLTTAGFICSPGLCCVTQCCWAYASFAESAFLVSGGCCRKTRPWPSVVLGTLWEKEEISKNLSSLFLPTFSTVDRYLHRCLETCRVFIV